VTSRDISRKLTPVKLLMMFGIVILLIFGLQITNNQIFSKLVTPTTSSSNVTNMSNVKLSTTFTSINNTSNTQSNTSLIGVNYTSNTKSITNLTSVDHVSNTKPSKHLAFFLRIYGQYYVDNLKVFVKNLKNGDYLLIRGNTSEAPTVIQKVEESRPLFDSGVHVNSAIFYYAIRDIVTTVPKLPHGIDFIVYDYERGDNYSPEFTTNESKSIEYFDQARSVVAQYNKNTDSNARLMVTLPYGELHSANWDWRLAAKHMDVIDMQLQSFLQDHSAIQRYISNTADIEAGDRSLIFAQLSITPVRGTVQENVNAINEIQNSQVGAFLIWYQSIQTSDLAQFFRIMRS